MTFYHYQAKRNSWKGRFTDIVVSLKIVPVHPNPMVHYLQERFEQEIKGLLDDFEGIKLNEDGNTLSAG